MKDRRKEDRHQKEIIKEAIKEWLDEKYTNIGRWTVYGLVASGVVGLLYLIAWSNGWRLVK